MYPPLRVHNIALAEINIIFRRVRKAVTSRRKVATVQRAHTRRLKAGTVFGTIIEGVMIANRLDSPQGWVFKLLGEG